MEQQEQLRKLREVFISKQKMMDAYTKRIAEMLTPTLLLALFELMELKHEDVVWEDFHLQGDAIVLKVAVTYSPMHNTSLFLELLLPPEENEEVAQVTQRIVFGVPLDVVFMEKDALKEWCLNVVHKQRSPTDLSKEQYAEPPELTEDQLAQILHFQRMYTKEQ